MTKDDIIRIAREAELYLDGANQREPMYVLTPEELKRFANLAVAAERDACAQICDKWAKTAEARLIRARGQS